jgi:hypothetical protein
MQAYVSVILVVHYGRLQDHLQGGAVRFKVGRASQRTPPQGERASRNENGYAEVHERISRISY